MKLRKSLVAQQIRLSEWTELVRDCQNRPQGIKIDEWRQLYVIIEASYYWRRWKVRETYFKIVEQIQIIVEVLSSTIHPANMTVEYKIAAVIRDRNNLILEITKQVSTSFLQTLLGVVSSAQ